MTTGGTVLVRAAGGVVWRRAEKDGNGGLEVLVVHRPRYDDWSLPKGKVDAGESDEDCALREVEEETGLACELGPHLGQVSYTDQKGRPKIARYWAMTPLAGKPLAGEFVPNREVDEVKWLPVPGAVAILTRPDDGKIVEILARTLT